MTLCKDRVREGIGILKMKVIFESKMLEWKLADTCLTISYWKWIYHEASFKKFDQNALNTYYSY